MPENNVTVIDEGTYHLNVVCPDCDQTVMFPIELIAERKSRRDGAKLRPMISAKSAEHKCGGETQPPMFEGNGAAAAPEMSES